MLRPPYLTPQALNTFIDQAISEDLGPGDYSSLSVFEEYAAPVEARLLVKENCVLAGVELAEYIFNYYDPNAALEVYIHDGHQANKGDVAFTVKANPLTILGMERLVLNCMQRMSGIATLTHNLASKITHTKAKILDTRKTTPNFRLCEKWAVKIGGGENHRYALYDMIMLKDNHIDYAGGIHEAVDRCRRFLQHNQLDLKIEVETRNIYEVEQALMAKVDRIMLDNFDIATLNEAIELVDRRAETEASGGITGANLVEVAETGVDFISMGALTHSARNIDLSLKAV